MNSKEKKSPSKYVKIESKDINCGRVWRNHVLINTHSSKPIFTRVKTISKNYHTGEILDQSFKDYRVLPGPDNGINLGCSGWTNPSTGPDSKYVRKITYTNWAKSKAIEFISLNVTNNTGELLMFNLKINEDLLNGELSYNGTVYKIVKLSKDISNDLSFEIKLNHLTIKHCKLQAKKENVNYLLDFYIAKKLNQTFKLEKKEYDRLISFLKIISLKDVVTNNEDNNFGMTFRNTQFNQVPLYFFIAHKFSAEIDFTLNKIIINNELKHIVGFELPGEQGKYYPLGLYNRNQKIQIAWEFETGFISGLENRLKVGVFNALPIQNLETLEQYNTEVYSTYIGVKKIQLS